jgi:hypothetical protein
VVREDPSTPCRQPGNEESWRSSLFRVGRLVDLRPFCDRFRWRCRPVEGGGGLVGRAGFAPEIPLALIRQVKDAPRDSDGSSYSLRVGHRLVTDSAGMSGRARFRHQGVTVGSSPGCGHHGLHVAEHYSRRHRELLARAEHQYLRVCRVGGRVARRHVVGVAGLVGLFCGRRR